MHVNTKIKFVVEEMGTHYLNFHSLTGHLDMNNIDEHLEFKLSEEHNTINYLDLSIHTNNNSIDLGIYVYRKSTHTDVTKQFPSNHPLEHILAAFNIYINRMLTRPITKKLNIKNGKSYLQ